MPPDPWSAPVYASRWQEAYLRYREYERQFTDGGSSLWAFLFLLHAAAEGRQVFNRRLWEYQFARRKANGERLQEPPLDLIDELRGLADLRSSYNCDAVEFVFDDVYHLAYHMLRSWRPYGRLISPAADCSRLYRGQRVDEWDVGA